MRVVSEQVWNAIGKSRDPGGFAVMGFGSWSFYLPEQKWRWSWGGENKRVGREGVCREGVYRVREKGRFSVKWLFRVDSPSVVLIFFLFLFCYG